MGPRLLVKWCHSIGTTKSILTLVPDHRTSYWECVYAMCIYIQEGTWKSFDSCDRPWNSTLNTVLFVSTIQIESLFTNRPIDREGQRDKGLVKTVGKKIYSLDQEAATIGSLLPSTCSIVTRSERWNPRTLEKRQLRLLPGCVEVL